MEYQFNFQVFKFPELSVYKHLVAKIPAQVFTKLGLA